MTSPELKYVIFVAYVLVLGTAIVASRVDHRLEKEIQELGDKVDSMSKRRDPYGSWFIGDGGAIPKPAPTVVPSATQEVELRLTFKTPRDAYKWVDDNVYKMHDHTVRHYDVLYK